MLRSGCSFAFRPGCWLLQGVAAWLQDIWAGWLQGCSAPIGCATCNTPGNISPNLHSQTMPRGDVCSPAIKLVLRVNQDGCAEADRRLGVKQHRILTPTLECAPAGGQNGRFELTPSAGLPENGSHDEAPVPQHRVQAAGC